VAYQSLYRRYRSQNFSEILGQSHITTSLRNAVAEGRYGHAYLFSGPRGTGKTSTARVLAKALNCENLDAGEPCGKCKSCVDIEHGSSFDLHELDAASNNKVDDVRDLIAKVALGSPGRTKVYILDEVHMLTPGAENALLKTLEEPPDHVVFVLATTEPHKVVETIRSRTQHYEFKLLPAAELDSHVRWVIQDAELDVDEDGIEFALRQGGGSARDTLSALDLVATGGGTPEGSAIGSELALAIAEGDASKAISAVQEAIATGREPRTIGETTLRTLRHAFLVSMGAPLDQLSEAAQDEASTVASALGPATITRSLETIGQALIEMRQAPDPRVPLEVALLRLARGSGEDRAALLQRLEVLEGQVASLQKAAPTPDGSAPPLSASAPQPTAPQPTAPQPTAPQPTASQPIKPAPNRSQRRAPVPPSPAAHDTSEAAPEQATEPTQTQQSSLTKDQLESALAGSLLDNVAQKTRTRFQAARLLSLEGVTATFAAPNNHYLSRVQEVANEVENAVQESLGATIKITVVLGENSPPSTNPTTPTSSDSSPDTRPSRAPDPVEEVGPIDQLDDANDIAASGVERISQAFPGAQVVPPPNS